MAVLANEHAIEQIKLYVLQVQSIGTCAQKLSDFTFTLKHCFLLHITNCLIIIFTINVSSEQTNNMTLLDVVEFPS